jgi:hypothetical protein
MSALGQSRQIDTLRRSRHVRFAPKADKSADELLSLLCANRVLMRRSKRHPYSITSTAMASTPGDEVTLGLRLPL